MGKLVNLRSCLALLSVLACSPAAQAGGKLLARSADVRVTEARVALSQGPERASAWYQLRVEGSSDELLWLLPLPAQVGVDVGSPSFFDALEESTAPRVLPPASKPPTGCSKPTAPETVSPGDAEAALPIAGQELFSDEASLSAKLAELGYSVEASDKADLVKVLGSGRRLLGLRLSGLSGSASTLTVRLHGPGLGVDALALLRAPAGQSIPWTLWELGEGRGKSGVGEVEIVPSSLRWVLPGQTNYASLRGTMLEKSNGATLIVEAAGPRPLRELSSVAGVTIPAFVDGYLKRAFERGEGSFELGTFSDTARKALTEVFPDPCPRGDLLATSGFACAGSPPASLVPAPTVDDLAFVFAGDAAQRWVTRLAGLVPGATIPPALSPSFAQGSEVSLVYTPASVWDGLCSSGTGGSTGSSGSGTGATGGKTGGVTPPGSAGAGVVVEDPTYYEPSSSSSCDAVFLADGCSSSDSGSSSDSCNCNDTSTTEESDASSEGCSCDDSSGSGDSCDGGDSSSGDSCSGSDGSSGGDACGSSSGGGDSCSGSSGGGSSCASDCSVGHKKKPPRLSKWLMLLAAVSLPLRRATRPGAKKKVVAG